jgi:hypothetical protein
MRRLAAVIASLLFFNPFSMAQGNLELRGTVTDELGGAVAGAEVTLDDGKGQRYTAHTDELGRYRLANIKPGIYKLAVVAEGFATFTQEVDLTARRATPLNITLKVFIKEEIEIRTDSPGVSSEPDKNLAAVTISGKDLEALPDDPDELLQMLRQIAGTTGSPGDAAVFVNGFRESGRIPPRESIQMIRINSNPFAAEYSEPGRGRIEIVTKPGSDTYHGSFWLNFNDESLNARNPMAERRAPQQIRRYGATLSGPIMRNRWGFFLDFFRREEDENSVINAKVLDPATLLLEPFVKTILTPSRSNSLSLRTNFLATKKHTVGLEYRHSGDSSFNHGGGFDLPERAAMSSSGNDTLRFSLTSIATERAVNEMRLQLERRTSLARAVDQRPAIIVLDAFSAGGNQGSLFSQNTNQEMELSNNLTYTHNKHTFKAGVRLEALRRENTNRSNFGGTFTFGADFERDQNGNIIFGPDGRPIPITPLENYRRTLLGLPGYGPSQFSIVRGDPFVSLAQWEMAWFFQDDWRFSRQLTISYGLRHEFQTNLDDRVNFAPRFGLAWSPDTNQRSVIRIGAGLFYSRLDPGITFETIRLDGKHQEQITIDRPNFFPNIPGSLVSTNSRPPTVRIKSEGMNAPYSIISTMSYERQLPWKLFGSALMSSINYTWQRGVHLLRTRNVNAPLPGSGQLPFPDRGPILQFESTGKSTRHELRISLNTGFSRRLTFFSNYVLASARSDTDGAFTAPSNSYDISTEFGRAGFDQRHAFFMGGSISLPRGFRLSPFINVSSGRPFDIRTGRDNNGDTLFTDRPSFANPGDPAAVVTRFGTFNPNPRPGEQIIPRNFGDGPGQFNLSLNISKTFGFGATRAASNQRQGRQSAPPIVATRGQGGGFQGGFGRGGPGPMLVGQDARHRYNLTLSVNIWNLLNHTNLAGFNGVLTSPFFGLANRAMGARRIEASLRFNF